ncbi:MAG TPA: hypothetical protein VIE39_05085 [Thermoanaerobaculia bacterium]
MTQPTDKPRRPVPAEDREIDYLICRQCGTPSYVFEMDGSTITEALCLVCGNDESAGFNIGEEAGSEENE